MRRPDPEKVWKTRAPATGDPELESLTGLAVSATRWALHGAVGRARVQRKEGRAAAPGEEQSPAASSPDLSRAHLMTSATAERTKSGS